MLKTDFYFDFLSPYSYFAWKNLQEGSYKDLRKKLDLIYKPVLMGKLFSHHEIKGPGEIPAKRYLMLKNCFRYADRSGIAFHPPSEHPFNPLYVLRLCVASCAGNKQEELISAVWDYVWGRGLKADDPEALKSYLTEKGFDAEELMEKSFSREAKLELKSNTKEALSKNVFGVPTFALKKELFWGNDSLPDLQRHVEGTESFDKSLFLDRVKDIDLN